MFGNWGRILTVDLTAGTTVTEELSLEQCRRTIGGSALAAELVHDRVSDVTDPFSPNNGLVFATGPFQASRFPGSAKWVASTKSPLTGSFFVSAAGGRFGHALKGTGFDAVFITGQSNDPVLLVIHNGTARIQDARYLWGLETYDAIERIEHAYPARGRSAVTIGPAGERQVAIACLVVDGYSFAGRGGLGAVMGSKRLKGVVALGEALPEVADSECLAALTRECSLQLHDVTKETYGKNGTANDVVFCESVGDLPIKYWAGYEWASGARNLGAPRYTEVLNAKRHPCIACPIGCHRHVSFNTSDGGSFEGPGPEYESLGLLGSACLVDDLEAVVLANDRCNRLGIDTISAGSFVAFSMECRERGLLSDGQCDGLSLRWGDRLSLLGLIEMIGERRGIGAVFADGIVPAAKGLGEEAVSLAMHVKGVDLPAHDPRCYYSLALNYATSPQGASHLRGFPHCGELGMLIPEAGYGQPTEKFSMEGKAAVVRLFQDYAVLLDSLVDCCFMQINGLSLSKTVDVLHAITGWDLDAAALLRVGERGFNLQRMLNLRDGLDHTSDCLPPRALEPSLGGPRAGKAATGFDTALLGYYRLRGWTDAGRPTRATLRSLDLPIKGNQSPASPWF